MEVILAKILPFMVTLAVGSGTMSNIVKWAATIGGGLVALFLIINIVKEGLLMPKVRVMALFLVSSVRFCSLSL